MKATYGTWKNGERLYQCNLKLKNSKYIFEGRLYFRGLSGTMMGHRHYFFPYENQQYLEFNDKQEAIDFVKWELVRTYNCPRRESKKMIADIKSWDNDSGAL